MEVLTISHNNRGLRILTIDNGGLQSISVLLVLKDVCEALSKAEGLKAEESKAPHELFDIIGGVGTGGWLAILLGRCRLRIDQCMSIYIRIANAIDPTRQDTGTKAKGLPAAIDQASLIERVDHIIKEHGINTHMLDSDKRLEGVRQCYTFAVGVVKPTKDQPTPGYHLFRSYQLPRKNWGHPGPNPANCSISMACAATTAAKDFCKEYQIGNTTYWDEGFPQTHNVSCLALDEAEAIFGEHKAPEVVLSVSPGIPTDPEINDLRKIARKNASKTFRAKDRIRRAFSADGVSIPFHHEIRQPSKSNSYPSLQHQGNLRRTDTSISTSSQEKERQYQQEIRDRLNGAFGNSDIYQRLDLGDAPSDRLDQKPYVSDIGVPDQANQLADAFLGTERTRQIIQHLEDTARRFLKHIPDNGAGNADSQDHAQPIKETRRHEPGSGSIPKPHLSASSSGQPVYEWKERSKQRDESRVNTRDFVLA